GFYAPSQLVQDARRHGAEVLAVDVAVSDWDCTLENGDAHDEKNGDAHNFRSTKARASTSPSENCVRPHFQGTDHVFRSENGDCPQFPCQPALRLGLRMVKGLAEAADRRIVAARALRAFASVPDLAERAA